MNITRDQLRESDFNMLFTRDPATFFEAVLINILWDKDLDKVDMALIEQQKLIFNQWFKYYSSSIRTTIEQETNLELVRRTTDFEHGKLAGQIHALTNLPIRTSALGKSVDLRAVTKLLKLLKAQ